MVTKKRKILYIIIGILTALLCSGYFIFVRPYFDEISTMQKEFLGISDIEKKESAFKKKPTKQLAMKLMDSYLHVTSIKDEQKAIYYGQKAIELGVNDSTYGYLVNLWLSSIYLAKDRSKFCYYFNKALLLDKEGKILRYKYHTQEGIDDRYIETCQKIDQ